MSVTLRGDEADLRLSPGYDVIASIALWNEGNVGINYPCAGLMFDHPGVSVSSRSNPFSSYYYLEVSAGVTYQLQFSIADDVPIGTVVRGFAWTDVLNTGCSDGGTTEFEFVVEAVAQ